MTTLVASDLDRTLIYSAGASELAGGGVEEMLCVEHYQGAPLSYLTPGAAENLSALAKKAYFVPVTTRTREQYGRIQLPISSRYAICGNGGHILLDGEPDPTWHDEVMKRLASDAAPLAEIRARLASSDDSWTLKRRQAEDLFCYLVVDRAAMPASFVDDLVDWCAERGWRVSVQGRKVYAVPVSLTKSAAVERVREWAGADVVLAAGDSLLDAELLAAADAGMRPGHGELADTRWSAPHVKTLTERGIHAGERITEWFLKTASPTAPR